MTTEGGLLIMTDMELTRKQFQDWGKKGGQAKSPRKTEAARKNGKAGRPVGAKDKKPRKRRSKP